MLYGRVNDPQLCPAEVKSDPLMINTRTRTHTHTHMHTYTHTHTTHTHTHTLHTHTQWSGRQPPPCIDAPPSMPLLKHIMNQAYSRAVTNPEDLNSYEPFSPEVRACVSHSIQERNPTSDAM